VGPDHEERVVSDRETRALERAAALGDADAFASLTRAAKRAEAPGIGTPCDYPRPAGRRWLAMSRSGGMNRYGRVTRRVGVVELALTARGEPSMMATRSRDIVRVLWVAEKLHVGSTDHCAYRVHMREALAEADARNAREQRLERRRVLAARKRGVCS
jgi:hypothetical protein